MSHTILFAGENIRACDSAQFDGTNDNTTRGAAITGVSDSKTGIVSAWVRLDGGDASIMHIFSIVSTVGGGTIRFAFERDGSNKFRVVATNAVGASILDILTTASYTSSASWHHILASWDLTDVGKRFLYVDDSADISASVYTNDTIKYSGADGGCGGAADGTRRMNGCLAEVYFAPGQYLDFSVVSNRRKFRSYSGRPVYLGADGSLPTGTAAPVYCHLDPAESAANFATNRGTGGNFTVTGALTTGSSSPST